MPRKRSPIGIAAGKLLIAIQKETAASEGEQTLSSTLVKRAQLLLQATHQGYALGLLNGKSVAEYFDADWVAQRASIRECVEQLESELRQS